MTNASAQAKSRDIVGDFVDEAIRNPSRAEEIKAELRKRLSQPVVVSHPSKARIAEPEAREAEDLWDNVPI